MKATLTFSSNKDYSPVVRDWERLELIRDELQEIRDRELERMDSLPGLDDTLEEIIHALTECIDYEPSDEEMGYGSEPPITTAEMQTAA